jgi:hypothetical protein
MRTWGRVSLLAGTLLMCATWQSASAAGFGVYLKTENDSSVDWTLSDPGFADEEADGSIRTQGVGFVLDTAPTDQDVFNYRLNVGYERLEGTIDHIDPSFGIFSEEFNLDGLAVDHTFGFAVFKKEKVRVWLGPQLKVGFYAGSDSSVDTVMARLGIGFLVGANFKVASHFTIAGTVGVSASGYGGVRTFPNSADQDITASGKAAPNFHVSFLF